MSDIVCPNYSFGIDLCDLVLDGWGKLGYATIAHRSAGRGVLCARRLPSKSVMGLQAHDVEEWMFQYVKHFEKEFRTAIKSLASHSSELARMAARDLRISTEPLQRFLIMLDAMGASERPTVDRGELYWRKLKEIRAGVFVEVRTLLYEIKGKMRDRLLLAVTADRASYGEIKERPNPTVIAAADFIRANPGQKGDEVARGISRSHEYFRRDISPELRRRGFTNDRKNGWHPPGA